MFSVWFKSKTHWWLFLGVAFIAFSPCLLFNQAYFANDLLAFFGPSRAFFKAQLAQGHFPLWNPYMLGGQPFLADLQNLMFYLPNYLTLPFSVAYGSSMYFFIHMFLAALGMRYLLKSLGLSETASRLGALIYALSGEFWWEMIHPTIIATLAWLPWFLACLENLSRDRRPRQAFAMGFCFAVLFSAGSFQLVTSAVYGGLAFFAFRWFHWRKHDNISLKDSLLSKKFLTIVLFGLWGSLPVVACLVPMNEFSIYSTRRAADQTYDNFNGQFSMRPHTTYEFLFPTMGLPDGKTPEMANQEITDTVNYDNEFMGIFGYLGIWAPFLAFLAFRQKEKKFAVFLAVIAALSLMTAWGRYFPLHRILCMVLPVINLNRTPFRFIDIYVIFVCLLGAYGFQVLDRSLSDMKIKNSSWIFGGLGYAGILGVISLAQIGLAWRETLGITLGAAGLFLWGTESWKKVGKYLFLGALLLPLFLNAWNDFQTGPSSNLDFQSKFPALGQLGKTYPLSRFILNAQTLPYPVEEGGKIYAQYFPENTASFFGLRTPGGYNPLLLKKSEELKTLPQQTYLQLLAVRGILVGRDAGEQKGFTHQALDSSLHLYQFNPPPDFVTAPSQIQVIADDAKQLEAMKDPAFHPADTAILSADLPDSLRARLTGQKASLQYQLLSEEPDRQLFQVSLDKDNLVVFSEVNFPGWKARVDGKPTDLFTANHTFRSLFLPPGSHQVEFIFEPSWLKPLVAGLALWVFSVLVYVLFRRKDLFSGSKPLPSPAGQG